MKKHLILLSALFLLVGCEGASKFTPTDGGVYDPIADELDLIDKQRRVNSLGTVSAPSEIVQNATLSLEDVSVVANFSDNTTETVHPEVIQLDTSRLGDQTGVVVFGGKTNTFTINVKVDGGEASKTPVEITSVVINKTLGIGDNLTLEDVDIVVSFDDESSEALHPTSIELDTSHGGLVDVTVSYGDITKVVQVNIDGESHAPTLVSLEIVSGIPSEIAKDSSLDPNNVYINAVYSDGNKTENIHPTSISLDSSVVGTAYGRCLYGGLSVGFSVEVIDSSTPEVVVSQVQVTNAPSSVYVGGSISPSEVSMTILYSDYSVQVVTATSVDFNSAVPGTITATAHYNELSANFTVTVIDPSEEEEEEEEVLMCTYKIYFSYSCTSKYNPVTKKDEDAPLLQFTARMLYPLGHVPEGIGKNGNTEIDVDEVISKGATLGFTVDPAFPNFLGFSAYGLCLSIDDIWDFTQDYKQQAVVNLYGIWTD